MDNLTLGFKSLIAAVATAFSITYQPVFSKPQPVITPTPSPISAENIIVRNGEYSYSGHTLKYSLRIPKDGGKITGNFSGVCEGPITGNFDGKEGGQAEGEAKASCKIAIFNYDLKANYIAYLYLKQGKVDVNWTGKIPYTPEKGSFTINFEPVN